MLDLNTIAFMLLLLFITAPSTAFPSIFSFFQSKQEYTELGQPWYRIPEEDAGSSMFGKHFVPYMGPEERPYWTDIERQTFHCVTRACVCEFFGGSNATENPSIDTCRLKNGSMLKRAVRKEIRMLSDEERMAVEKALNDMKHDGTFNRLSRVHKHYGVHSGPAFMLWHRELLKRFELTLRKYQPTPYNLGIPYWDSSLDSMLPDPKDSIIFTPTFLGTTNDEGRVITGPYANWTTMEGRPYIVRKIGENPEGECFSPARIDWAVQRDDVNHVLAAALPLSSCETHSIDQRFLEYSHDYVHFFISGDMLSSWSSANDIIFLLHHSMVDYIYEMFRQNSQSRDQRERDYPESDPRCFPVQHNRDSIMPFLGITNKDGLSNGYTDNMYEFAPRPTCEERKRDCGSKYLYCDVKYSFKPTCMSKIRLGGNCKGFEGTDICYQAECIKGRCEPPVPGMRDFKLKPNKGISIKPFIQHKLSMKPSLNMK